MNELTKFDEIKKEIDMARDIRTLSNMGDQLEAIRIWAKQSKQSLEVQNQIAEYRLRVERKKGSWLKKNIRKFGETDRRLTSTESTTKLSDIGISRDESSKAQMIANLDDEQFEEYIDVCKKSNEDKQEEITLAGAVRLAKQIFREEKINDQKENLNSLKPIANGVFDVIVIDPPWNYGKTYNPDVPMGRITSPYPEMSMEKLKKLTLPSANNCILWLWTTNGFMKEAYELANIWGFEVKTILTWNKVNMGVGYWLRNVTEHCLLCIKGQPLWTNKSFTTLLTEKRTEHSKKPISFYKMIDEICNGRKLDYFARQKRKGWIVYGDEV